MKKTALMLLLAAIMIVAAACGGDQSSTPAEGNNDTNHESAEQQAEGSEQLEGEVAIDGSSTVFPIMEAVSEEYVAEQPKVKAPVAVSGSGGGFKRFVVGETDLSNASRPIKDKEKTLAEENGIDFVELKLAFDGLSVVVSSDNDWGTDLTVDELKQMWKEGSEVKTWKDIRPEWPEEEIKFFSPGTDSGTYDYWNEVILEDEPIRRDTQLSEDDNVLVQGIAGEKGAIGFFGYAYYLENKDKLNVVAIDNGEGAVTPDGDTIQNGEYAPLSRPLFTYVNVKSLEEKTHVYDYVTYTLNNSGALAEEVGYVALPDSDYQEQLNLIKEKAGK
ncbi:PstS family phosphate ABC transporter substrate-binding protein [Bacillus solimangrovi]|uniref:Phosphate-binding protein n=1 Tax=Bacillus solimangrovi TaxID=1305675 RepID=A0A1E5LFQ7_9BACI|nr:PstS family phosphate ABC transporter substrate-binding protein [Bacillus solimangrovi]OEH92917.1 phosphate-binding protein [Bacillus solimangrovi]